MGGVLNKFIVDALEDEELQASIARETTEGELNDLRLGTSIHPGSGQAESSFI